MGDRFKKVQELIAAGIPADKAIKTVELLMGTDPNSDPAGKPPSLTSMSATCFSAGDYARMNEHESRLARIARPGGILAQNAPDAARAIRKRLGGRY